MCARCDVDDLIDQLGGLCLLRDQLARQGRLDQRVVALVAAATRAVVVSVPGGRPERRRAWEALREARAALEEAVRTMSGEERPA